MSLMNWTILPEWNERIPGGRYLIIRGITPLEFVGVPLGWDPRSHGSGSKAFAFRYQPISQ
jgi:hypothetical protein